MSNNNYVFDRFKEYINQIQFDAIKIGIASPEKIKALSYGEVKKIETINYRTLRPEKDGLFCARIFGPQKDWECNCGKYKRMKHRGVLCEKCGVEVIQSRVRRERMAHIVLSSPVCHVWFLKGIPSYLSIILDKTVKDLEHVVYLDAYMVVSQGDSPFAENTILTPSEYFAYTEKNPEDFEFKAGIGAEVIREILSAIDLEFEVRVVEDSLEKASSVAAKHKFSKRLRILRGMLDAGIRPEWMVLTHLPVIAPNLRPLVPLEGGRFASSDLNDLYRRVINRNVRLKRLISLAAPSVIVKNEKRMLQEAVDALLDNGKRGQAVKGSNKRPLKSLSEVLRGKQGRFRQNLLGKRVDYSARSVIVVEPELKMHQCGLPKLIALELFKPYVCMELQKREVATNLRAAKKMISEKTPEVWSALEEVVKNHPVMLNRAPTLHRLGFQGFFPVLIEGKAIQLHPLVCGAYNADFDGDTMSVHVPLGRKAKLEVENLMFASKNILSPATGRPLMVPTQEMVLGLYYMTKEKRNVKGSGLIFSEVDEVVYAYQHSSVNIQAPIKVRMNDSEELVETTVGRVVLYSSLPEGSDFKWVNHAMKASRCKDLIYKLHLKFGWQETSNALDKIKELGFKFATSSGISLGIDDVLIPAKKEDLISEAKKEITLIEEMYRSGAITNGERSNKVIQVWAKTSNKVADEMLSELEKLDIKASLNDGEVESLFNPIFMMLDSGAKGSKQQIRQLGGMRGLMSNPSEEIIENPVLSNFKEGLSVFEYFISTHGARKGLADTALKTADAGYLTRRLVDVAQDVVVKEEDCESFSSVNIGNLEISGKVATHVADRVFGRVCAQDIIDPLTNEKIASSGDLVTDEIRERLKQSSIVNVRVRSPLNCLSRRGVCVKCYGMDLSKIEYVDIGTAVGVIAAQSIGEPGTQLTLRTFHIGGAASGLVEENFRKSIYKGKVVFKDLKIVKNKETGSNIVLNRTGSISIQAEDGRSLEEFDVDYGSVLLVEDSSIVEADTKLLEWNPYKVIISEFAGKIEFIDLVSDVTLVEKLDEESGASNKIVAEGKIDKLHPCIAILDSNDNEMVRYHLPVGAQIMVNNGDKVVAGHTIITIPRDVQRAQDITGGLPKVVELFEARNPKDAAILTEVSGKIEFGGIFRGMRRINVVTQDSEVVEYSVSSGKHIEVIDGDIVRAGQALTSGDPSVHDILRVRGVDSVQEYLVKGVQEVYRSQGVTINDKHIEIIVRQMLRKCRVVDPGDTTFVIGDNLSRVHVREVNEALVAEGKKPAIVKPVLMGITKASLGTESFLSAASFQETTKVLSEAAIVGQVDYLDCLKSNVAIGRLISAGTGVASFRNKYIGSDESSLEKEARSEEEMEAQLDNISLF